MVRGISRPSIARCTLPIAYVYGLFVKRAKFAELLPFIGSDEHFT